MSDNSQIENLIKRLSKKITEIDKRIDEILGHNSAYRKELDSLYEERYEIEQTIQLEKRQMTELKQATAKAANIQKSQYEPYPDHEARVVARVEAQLARRAKRRAEFKAKVKAFKEKFQRHRKLDKNPTPKPSRSK